MKTNDKSNKNLSPSGEPVGGCLGKRQNNPLNIRKGSDWKGAVWSPNGFCAFKDRVYGYRAAFCTLNTYGNKGVKTLGAIINRWAPPTENDTEHYISFVEKATGFTRDKVMDIRNEKEMVALVGAMAQIESGIFNDGENIRNGYLLFKEGSPLPPEGGTFN